MASAGAPVLPAMPDFSDHNNPFSTAGDMRFHLQNLLDSKEKQLQQAGTLGQRVLAQQMELEERIRQLQEIEADKSEDDEIDEDARERYRELADTVLSWDSENAQLSNAFGGSSKVRAFLPHATNNACSPHYAISVLQMAKRRHRYYPMPNYPAKNLNAQRLLLAPLLPNRGGPKMRLIELMMLVRWRCHYVPSPTHSAFSRICF